MANGPYEPHDAVREALLAGRKIEAIRLYRAANGSDLYAAKQAVDAIEAQMRQTSPDRFRRPAGGGGGRWIAAAVLLALLIGAAALAAWLLRGGERALPPSHAGPPAQSKSMEAVPADPLAGDWVITNPKRSLEVRFEPTGDGEYVLRPEGLVYSAAYTLDGDRLRMAPHTGAYRDFVWQRRDADHWELINSEYAGSTLTRAGAAAFPGPPLAATRPAAAHGAGPARRPSGGTADGG